MKHIQDVLIALIQEMIREALERKDAVAKAELKTILVRLQNEIKKERTKK